eukprot:387443-Pleurochrysis_carterae.AAC.1
MQHDAAHSFSDSDWATHHCTSGYLFVYGQAAISWASKKQATVALSSCEAETSRPPRQSRRPYSSAHCDSQN